jgi:hypothetical protein
MGQWRKYYRIGTLINKALIIECIQVAVSRRSCHTVLREVCGCGEFGIFRELAGDPRGGFDWPMEAKISIFEGKY